MMKGSTGARKQSSPSFFLLIWIDLNFSHLIFFFFPHDAGGAIFQSWVKTLKIESFFFFFFKCYSKKECDVIVLTGYSIPLFVCTCQLIN